MKRLKKYGDGGKTKPPIRNTDEVPSRYYMPPLPALNPQFVNAMQNAPAQSYMRQSDPRASTIKKAANIARNPMTALSYKTRGQDIPDNLDMAEKNRFDDAVNIMNPMTYLDAAGRTLSLKHFRDEGFTPDALVKTGLDAAMIYGVGNEFEVGSNPSNMPTVGLKQTKSYRVPNDNGEYMGFTSWNNDTFFPHLDEPVNAINAPGMEAAISDARRRYIESIRTGNIHPAHTIVPTRYDLQTIEHNGRFIPGVNYTDFQQSNPQYSDTSQYQPLVFNRPDAAQPRQSIKKGIPKRSIQQLSQPIPDTTAPLPENRGMRYDYYHSHNGEPFMFDSTRVVAPNPLHSQYGGNIVPYAYLYPHLYSHPNFYYNGTYYIKGQD